MIEEKDFILLRRGRNNSVDSNLFEKKKNIGGDESRYMLNMGKEKELMMLLVIPRA